MSTEGSESTSQAELNLGLPKILTTEEQLKEALTKVSALYEQLKQESAAPVTLALGEDDVLLVFNVELHTKDKMEYCVKGAITLPLLLSESLLRESFRNYTQTVYNSVIRPVENKFNVLVNSRLEAHDATSAAVPNTAFGILSPPPQFGNSH